MGNKNALRKPNDQEIIMLMASTGLSRSEVLEWHERFLVDHPSGYLNKYEFIDTYKRTYASSSESVAEACALFTFAAVDLDHNGKVSFSEFIVFSGVANKSSSSSYEQRLGMAFDIFDVNSDGKIDSCELLKVYEAIAKMKGYDLKHASEQVDKLLKQFGAESAGSSLNKAEFIAALQGGEIFCLFHK